ncbi:MAG: protein kinase [Deltaproteobacteria bacterium]|nr:protein kinase [Deltaproteobacteria bacterium]
MPEPRWGSHADELAPTVSPSTPPPDARGSGSGSSASLPALFVGHVLADRWEVGERIGMGGMASVHRGLDRRLGRKVAIKILHPHVAESADSRERLAREARAIAQLKHENVIEVYDYSIDDPSCTWLVSELVEGHTLKQSLEDHPRVMPEVAALIVSEVLRALRAAHAVGVVHRDVKPENVLIGADGRPKLSDFGIAQIVDEQKLTVTGNLVGSPSYMSPEQAEGRRTDRRTDLFSAGIMLYRMVTGGLPFAGANAIDTLRKVAAVDCVDPLELEPSCPGSVAAVIRKAMAKEIDARYQSADEMLADLVAIVRDAGLAAASEELPQFFGDPIDYTISVSPRVGRALFARGKALLTAGKEGPAIDCMSRARTLGISDEQSLDLVRVLSQRRDDTRARRIVLTASLAAVVVAIVGGGLFASGVWGSLEIERAAPPGPRAAPEQPAREAEPPPAAVEPEPEPAEAAAEEAPKLAPVSESRKKGGRDRHRGAELASDGAGKAKAPEAPPPAGAAPVEAAPPAETPRPPAEAGAPVPPATGALQVGASRWVDLFVNGARVGRAPDQSRYDLPVGTHQLRAVNPHCKPLDREVIIRAGETTRLRLLLDCP